MTAVVGVIASALFFTPLLPGPTYRAMGSGPDVIACVVVTSLTSALAVRLVAPRLAGVFANSVASAVTRSGLALALALALIWFGRTRLRSFGEGYADFVWVYPVVGVPLVYVAFAWAEMRTDWSLRVRTPAVRPLRLAWVAVLVAVVVAACVRSFTQPPGRDLGRWLRAMPVVGSISRVEPVLDETPRDYVYTVDATRFRRTCDNNGCSLALVTPTGEPTFRQWRVGHDAFEVRDDPRLGVMVFTNAQTRFAFHRATGRYFNVRGWHVVVGSAPPPSWVLAALVGLVASTLALVAFRRAPASLLAWRDARAGQLSAHGAIDFGDGAADLRLDDARDLAPGAVLVDFARHTHDHGPFRGSTPSALVAVTNSSHADVESAVAHVEESGEGFALLLATTACAPLLVEAACQFGG